VLHAESDLISRAMSAMPSLFLLLSFETFLGQIKHAVKLSTVVKSIVNLTQELDTKRQELDQMITDKQAELDALMSTKQGELNTLSQEFNTLIVKRNELTTQIETLKADIKMLNFEKSNTKSDILNDARQAKRQERLDALSAYLSTNPYTNLTEAAAAVGISRQTAGEYVKELGVHKNGNGWQVTK
jgi:chromosome segregation ATPase